MQNDHKGKIRAGHVETFYASGERGPEARADGDGGLLARGYYVRQLGENGGRYGPFTTRGKALHHIRES